MRSIVKWLAVGFLGLVAGFILAQLAGPRGFVLVLLAVLLAGAAVYTLYRGFTNRRGKLPSRTSGYIAVALVLAAVGLISQYSELRRVPLKYQKATGLLRSGQDQQALALLKEIYAVNPQYKNVSSLIAEIEGKLKRAEERKQNQPETEEPKKSRNAIAKTGREQRAGTVAHGTNRGKRGIRSAPEEQAEGGRLQLRTSYKQVGKLRDLSYGRVRRLEATVVIPRGRTREEVLKTLQIAARKIAARTHPDALVVNAFAEGEEWRPGTYTVGRAIYAPNGRWEDAGTAGPMRVNVELGSAYFTQSRAKFKEGSRVILHSPDGSPVPLYSDRGSWDERDVVASFSSGTPATVLEVYTEVLGGGTHTLRRYLVRVGVLKGWLDEKNLEAGN